MSDLAGSRLGRLPISSAGDERGDEDRDHELQDPARPGAGRPTPAHERRGLVELFGRDLHDEVSSSRAAATSRQPGVLWPLRTVTSASPRSARRTGASGCGTCGRYLTTNGSDRGFGPFCSNGTSPPPTATRRGAGAGPGQSERSGCTPHGRRYDRPDETAPARGPRTRKRVMPSGVVRERAGANRWRTPRATCRS